jgi:predicted house-cleaning noncanonical NTP pyrophosphatase (MazG superfamily)
MKYNKLVRDNIPTIIVQNWQFPITHVADDKEYWEKLKAKFHEEVLEYNSSDDLEELADVLEVFNAICDFNGIDTKDFETVRKRKADKSGAFKHKIILDQVEEIINA